VPFFIDPLGATKNRAYRRIFLDTGHLLGNIELSASINDYRAHLIGGFNDSQMNELLYLDSEKESVMTVIPLANLLNIRQNLPLVPRHSLRQPRLFIPKLPRENY
jgi:hypothetical protein